MTVLGGAKYFTLNDRLESNFINSIIDVTRLSGEHPSKLSVCILISILVDAWLITNGYDVGIVRVVGQAIKKAALTNRKNTVVAIGVCKWGSVKNFERLIPRPEGKPVINLVLSEEA